MSQFCPVCRTRLWSDPIFSARRLTCPRCGAEFKPTVPWLYFRILLLIVVVLVLVMVLLFTQGNLALLFFFVALGTLLWFLPRMISFQPIGGELTPSEGVLDPKQLELKMEDRGLDREVSEQQEVQRFRRWMVVLLAIAVAVIWLISRLTKS